MENQFAVNNPEKQSQKISLNFVVTQLLSKFQHLAARHQSFLINDVPDDLYMYADKTNLEKVISLLLISIIGRTRKSSVRISAQRYDNIILFRLKDSTESLTHISHQEWQKVNMMAKKLDDCFIEDEIRKHATITFSFRSLANAA